jgi:hypothetical protein
MDRDDKIDSMSHYMSQEFMNTCSRLMQISTLWWPPDLAKKMRTGFYIQFFFPRIHDCKIMTE